MKTVILIIILGLLLVVAAYMYISRNEVTDNRKPERRPARPIQDPAVQDTPEPGRQDGHVNEPTVRQDVPEPDSIPEPDPVPEPGVSPEPFTPKEEIPVKDSSDMNRTFWSEVRNLPYLDDKKKAAVLTEMLRSGIINRDQYAMLFSLTPEEVPQPDTTSAPVQATPAETAPVPAPDPAPVGGFDSDDWGTF